MKYILYIVIIGVAALSGEAAATVFPKAGKVNPVAVINNDAEKEIIELSKKKWHWMAAQKVDSLALLFHDEAVFVHMGATFSKEQELGVIKSGNIRYKHAAIHETSVRFIGNTAILLNRIRLDAIVGGNEVSNPFQVTEVYIKVDGSWKLGALS